MRKIVLLTMAAFLPLAAWAARVTLRDGTVVNGTFISASERNVVFQDESGARRRFDMGQVRSIDFDAPGGGTASNAFRDRQGTADRVDYARSDRRLAAGTEITVRTNERIESETATQGRTYSALVEKEVAGPSGEVAIPRGSEARLVVRNASDSGSHDNLLLDLESITADGRLYTVSTEDVERDSDRGLGANKRTGQMVGGGAALGALIGAIARGGKGAAIGAAVGAGAGAGTQVLTKGDKIRVPAESVLTFRLDRPLRLRPAQ